MKVRGIRGATTVDCDCPEDILSATRELLELLAQKNNLVIDDIAAIFFTTTPDLRSVFPARAARELGWTQTALLGAGEIDVPAGVPKCIRVLMLVNTERSAYEIVHLYLRQAAQLRDDLTKN
ncbi:MAG: chorismate mutase [Methylocystaceae bacterium]